MRNFTSGKLEEDLNKEWVVFKLQNLGKSEIEIVSLFIDLMENNIAAFDIRYPNIELGQWSDRKWNAAFHVVNASSVVTCYYSERYNSWGCKY